tara:strand:- start:330 stop:779 length:450 start_codon:yes stop_codon:yes gene_type:complete
MSRQLPVIIRDMTEDDTSFIYSTWLKSYRQSGFASSMSNDVFFTYHKELIAKILSQSSTKISLLVNENDHNQIYGYGVQQVTGNRSITHFVYVKYNFRHFGFATRLIDSMGLFPDSTNFITHLPRNYNTLRAKYGLEYNPYILNDILRD